MNYEKHFENYLQINNYYDLHPSQLKNINNNKFSNQIIENTIFYGPSGIGKYTQILKNLKKYSPSELKYEKKMSVTYNKQSYIFKISDIHFEIDMFLLGCNAKILWHEIYSQIIDILSAKQVKIGIILCKNFQDIHNELLDNFYNYMTNLNNQCVHIYYYIMTEQISFIPTNILKKFKIISFSRPSKNDYKKCIQNNMKYYENNIENYDKTEELIDLKKIDKINLESIQNIKQLYFLIKNYSENENDNQCQTICKKIIEMIDNKSNSNTFSFLKFRDLLYEILIYHLNIYECIWYTISYFIENKKISEENINEILIKTFTFFQYFNNNYRPIYHLEYYFLSIMKIVKGL
jgi:hypothetical protein